jgi:hypothetical protein
MKTPERPSTAQLPEPVLIAGGAAAGLLIVSVRG